jgi:6-phosphogluconolactonase
MAENIERIIVPDSNRLAEKGAEMFCEIAKKSISDRGRFIVAVSGGSTSRGMHGRLSKEPYLSDISWERTYIFWVDERMVDFDHPDSNFGTARKDLLEKIPIPLGQIYPMPVTTHPEDGAGLYQMTLKTFFQSIGSDDPVFDLIILGIGKDGHTASLFPKQAFTYPLQSWVISVKGGNPNIFRLTFTYLVLNSARHILFLVSGKDKAPIVQTLLGDNAVDLPAKNIRPLKGTLTWLLDQEAASLLF